MKIAHSASIRVFCGEGESEGELTNGLKWLAAVDFEKEKARINRQTALGFGDRKIVVLEVSLAKDRQVKAFLDNLIQRLPETQKQLLVRQLDSRVDDDANFFVRFEKETLAKHRELLLTDGGNCYHVKIKVAAFPATRKKAIETVKDFLSDAFS
ncbi:hypothetical protein HYU16_04890 [Candidatus Woesearchaeota archaeon]|nr:hypothetical protein [Candidatus Woesearchaeota archaeon]